MSRLIDVITNEVGFEHGRPANLADIQNAEMELDIEFAVDYKEYLLNCGVGGWGSHELTGLECDDRVNVVKVTLAEQERRDMPLKGMYVIEQTNIERIVIWQDADGRIYQTIRKSDPVLLCESLVEYIELDK